MQLGPGLRAARTRRGLTLAELALASGLSKGFVSQIENDKTSPSLDTLERLAAALDLRVVDLLHDASEPPPVPHIVRAALAAPDAPPEFRQRPARIRGRLLPDAPPSPVEPAMHEISPPGSLLRSFVVDLPPGATLGEQGHHHQGEESLVVLAGAVVADQAGGPVRLAAGDALTWTAGQPHRLLNRSPEPARLLVTLLTPASLGAGGVIGPPAAHRVPAPAADRPLRLVQMRAARQTSGQ